MSQKDTTPSLHLANARAKIAKSQIDSLASPALVFPVLSAEEVHALKTESARRDPIIAARQINPAVTFAKVKSTRYNGTAMQHKGKRKGKGKYPQNHRWDAIGTPISLLPDELDVELPYTYSTTLTNPGLGYASLRFQPNGIYDPDPAVGGTSFTGLADWATFFFQYRVISYSWRLEMINREAFPLYVDIYNSNTDPSSSVGASGQLFALGPYGRILNLSPTTGGRDTFIAKGHVPLTALFGSEMVETGPNFAGFSSGSNPTQVCFFGFNTRSAVVQTAAGVYFSLIIKSRVRFFDRRLLV